VALYRQKYGNGSVSTLAILEILNGNSIFQLFLPSRITLVCFRVSGDLNLSYGFPYNNLGKIFPKKLINIFLPKE
jgi:hypothetical protein